jgi:hypothetical protein
MSQAELPSKPESRGQVPSRCRVHLLPGAKPTDRGVVYRRGEEQFLLAWPRVKRAFAAEIGEETNARTVVFDLAVEVAGPELVLCRLAAEPGEPARQVARAIALGTTAEASTSGLEEASGSGRPKRWYPDVETLEVAELESIRFG